MIIANALMNHVLTSDFYSQIKHTKLNPSLGKFLDNPFFKQDDKIFFKENYTKMYAQKILSDDDIKLAYLDISGMESCINKIHIDDYVDTNIFVQAVLFLNEFKKKWQKNFDNDLFVAAISFQDDEIGQFATFTFHKQRKGEVVYDIDNIEKFHGAVMIYSHELGKVKQ